MPIAEQLVTDRKRARGQVERSALLILRALAAVVPEGQQIVECGAFCGRSTGWLLLGAQDGHGAHLTTVDPWGMRKDGYAPSSAEYTDAYPRFRDHMAAIGATPGVLTVKRGYAASCAAKWSGAPVGLLFHDAEHSADAVAADLAAWLPHLADDAVVALHDAGNLEFGVEAGAAVVLDTDGWDWAGRQFTPWGRHPDRRGLLVVRRREATA
jgi:hypothetical protein